MPLDIGADMGVAKFRYRSSGDPEEMITTLGFARNEGATAQECALELNNIWTTGWAASDLGVNWTYVGCDVAIGPPGAAEVGTQSGNLPGSGNFTTLPSNCALLIRKITAQQGKGGRGRMFLPAGHLSEGEIDNNGFLSNGAYAAAQESITSVFNLTSSSNVDAVAGWLLFHNTGTNPAGGTLADPITQLVVQTQIATQRQRMRR